MTVGRVSLVASLRRTAPFTLVQRAETIQARLDYELGRARRYGGSVTLIELQLGHGGKADARWQRFAATVAGSLRAIDTCYCDSSRIAVVLPETDISARAHVTDRILESARREGLDIEVTASTFPDEAPTSDALLRSLGAGGARGR